MMTRKTLRNQSLSFFLLYIFRTQVTRVCDIFIGAKNARWENRKKLSGKETGIMVTVIFYICGLIIGIFLGWLPVHRKRHAGTLYCCQTKDSKQPQLFLEVERLENITGNKYVVFTVLHKEDIPQK